MDENNNHTPETIPYVVHESEVARMERTIKRLFVICVLLIVVAVGTNAYWIWYEAQFMDETITVQQENADGINNYVGRDGNIDNIPN
jgi:deoxyribodipyrimidine photolyase-like uncharacterized protein